MHTGYSHKFLQFFNCHGSIQCLIEYLLVLLEVCLYHLPIHVHYMVDHIQHVDSHLTDVFIAKFCNVNVFNGYNYFVLGGLIHGYSAFKTFVCFNLCIVGLLAVSGSVIFSNGWYFNRNIQVFPWCSHLQCGVYVVLNDQANVTIFLPARVVGRLSVLAYNAWIFRLGNHSPDLH